MPKTDQQEIDWLLEHSQPPGTGNGPPATDWFKIEARKSGGVKTAKVYIMDEITPWGSGSRVFAEKVAGLDVDTIEMHINSPGGNFAEGIAIMNMLRSHKATVTATIEGLAASAATIVAMGADVIVAAQGSQMMVHEGSGLVYGPMADMLKMAQVLEKTNAQMAEIYADRAGGTAELWREAMNAETWYTAQEAVDAGLADRLDAKAAEGEVVAACTKWDLTVFAHAGRDKAPAPYTPTAGPPEKPEEEDEEMPNKYLVEAATRAGVKDADKFADDEKLSEAMVKAEADAKAAVDAKGKDADGKDGKDDEKPEQRHSSLPPGMVLVDRETIEALQKDGQEAKSVVKEFKAQARDTAIDAAIAAGKVPAARREHWQTFWDSDTEGAKAALEALPDNLVPLAPIGRDEGHGGEALDADYRRLYPDEE